MVDTNQQQQQRLSLLVDVWWTFVLPAVGFCSMIANMFNMFILWQLKPSNKIYGMLYAKAALNMIYLCACFWICMVKCGRFCREDPALLDWTFLMQLYEHFVFGFVGNVLAHTDLFVELFICVYRLCLVMGKSSSLATSSAWVQLAASNATAPSTRTAFGFLKASTTHAAAKAKKLPSLKLLSMPLNSRQQRSVRKWRVSFGSMVLVAVLVSALIYSPTLFMTKIVYHEVSHSPSTSTSITTTSSENDNDTNESTKENESMENMEDESYYELTIVNMKLYHSFITATTLYLRSFFMLLLILAINLVNYFQLNSKLSLLGAISMKNPNLITKASTQRIREVSDEFKRMLFYQSLLYVCGNSFGFVGTLLLTQLDGGRANPLFPLLPLVNNTLIFASLGLTLPLYAKFDRRFRTHLGYFYGPTHNTF